MIMPDGCSPDGSGKSRRNSRRTAYSRAMRVSEADRGKGIWPTLVQRKSLRARAGLTTFKTLKTDRGSRFVTGSLIGPLPG